MTVPVVVATSTARPGGGIPLLLGPSLGTTTRVWERAIPALAAVAPLYAWDLPGHGASPATAKPFTMSELAEGVLRAADAAGLDRFDVAGISLGGLAGLQLAVDHPDRVRGVTLICSLPRIGTREGWLQRAADVRAMGTPVLVTPTARRWFTPEFLDAERDYSARLLNGLLDIDDESYALCVDALRETDLWGSLPDGVSVIAGSEDTVVPIADAGRAAAAAHGILHPIEGASHLAPVERPAGVTAAMIEDRIRWEDA
jgi:pimeloyl-ACP methyl ester carboxylesterase